MGKYVDVVFKLRSETPIVLGPAAARILEFEFDEWANLFISKQQDYGSNHVHLGAKGQFADIWRKIQKLKKGLWDGEPLVGEQTEEILMDLIGHCFLTLDLIRTKNLEGTL